MTYEKFAAFRRENRLYQAYSLLKGRIYSVKARKFRGIRKIIYALTPPACLRNIGDHSQVLGIMRWLGEYFPGVPVIEIDKNQIFHCAGVIAQISGKDDLILLHSGGNLGDAGIWSEEGRRLIIKSFPDNMVVQLPQTIFFSDSEKGRAELELSRKVYSAHKRLTIIARDNVSYALAKEYFPGCRTNVCPDFALYLDARKAQEHQGHVLLCMRRDNESILSQQLKAIKESIIRQGMSFREYDTTLRVPIKREHRSRYFEQAMEEFAKARFVITDRFHGAVFSYLAGKACVGLPSLGHKMESGIKWFSDCGGFFFASQVSELPIMIKKALDIHSIKRTDFKKDYFTVLANQLGAVQVPAGKI